MQAPKEQTQIDGFWFKW